MRKTELIHKLVNALKWCNQKIHCTIRYNRPTIDSRVGLYNITPDDRRTKLSC